MAHTYPILLDVTDCRIVIIGGGAVAARKAAGLIHSGAKCISIISPELRGDFPEHITRQIKCYTSDDLEEADLIFAATDSTLVNDAVVRDAHALGIWVNRADGSDELPGDFSTPAKFDSGGITVTVSTGSPALAATIRDALQARFDPTWTAMAEAMKILRPMIKSGALRSSNRADLFRQLATPQAMEILRASGISGLKDWIARQ